MILNKFSLSFFGSKSWRSSFWLLVFVVFACNKSTIYNDTKSYVTVIHTAYGLDPVKVTVQGDTLSTLPVAFGQYSGYPNNRYDTIIAGVVNLELVTGSTAILQGNLAFQQGARYSMFVYDTLDARSTRLLVLQDNLTTRTDTFTYVRFINFTPASSFSFLLTDSTNRQIDSLGNTIPIVDTIKTPYLIYAGYNQNPGFYTFMRVRLGYYKLQVTENYLDPSAFIQLDSLHIDSLKIYNIYLQGFKDTVTGVNKFQVKSMPLN
jgi:hypothetical protein